MEKAKKLTGKKKLDAEKLCFDSILKLWDKREIIPEEKRPLKQFEHIFEIIKSINPDRKSPFFYFRKSTDALPKDIPNEIMKLLKTIEAIDKAARVWIEHSLNKAFQIASNDEIVEWIHNAYNLPNNEDLKVINSFLGVIDDKNETQEEKTEKQRVSLQNRIEQLDAFIDFSKNLRDSYNKDYEKL